MSVSAECAVVEEAIRRARSLVTTQGCPSPDSGTGDIDAAAESTRAATEMTHDLSGMAVTAHRRFALDNATSLTLAGRTDRELQSQMSAAADVTRAGAQRLDAIAGRTHATLHAAAGATSPGAQRVILSALRSQLSQATEVVDSVRRHGADLAGRAASLHYQLPQTPAIIHPRLPEGPIVWCLRPEGTFGLFRCSILHPSLKVSSYWSSTDDTGGSL